MNVLVVSAHPRPDSLTAALVGRFVDGLNTAGPHTVEVTDLAQEGFDPRISEGDLAHYHGTGPLPEDVHREQERVQRADVLVLAFPIYWWSMPALLKGWVDRVFTVGWAYGTDVSGRASGLLGGRKVHLLATGAGDASGYDKHGYRAAIATQIERGIFGFCGVRDVTIHLFLRVEDGNEVTRLANLSACHDLGLSSLTR